MNTLSPAASQSASGNPSDGSSGPGSTTGSSGSDSNPAFFGYDISLSKDEPPVLRIGAPKTVNPNNPSEQSSDIYPQARGDLLSCPLSFDSSSSPSCDSSIPPGSQPGDSFGLSANVAPDGTITACSPTKAQTCRTVGSSPGFCYQKKGNSTEWSADPRTAEQGCDLKFLDVVFLLDASGSIDKEEFKKVKNWVKEVASHFNIEDRTNKIGVVRYSLLQRRRPLDRQRFINTEIPLGSITNREKFNEAVDKIKPTKFQTFTSHALNKTVLDFQSSDGFNDPNTEKVLLLLTDGKSTDKEYLEASSNYVRSVGITTYAVGVGDADVEELREIATGTDTDERVYYVTDFDFLDSIANEIAASIVNATLENSQTSNKLGYELEYAEYGFSIASSQIRVKNILIYCNEIVLSVLFVLVICYCVLCFSVLSCEINQLDKLSVLGGKCSGGKYNSQNYTLDKNAKLWLRDNVVNYQLQSGIERTMICQRKLRHWLEIRERT